MAVSEDPNQMLCYCLGVHYGTVEEAIREHGCTKVSEVTQLTKAGGGCRSCHPEIRELMTAVREQGRPSGGGGSGIGSRLRRLFGGKTP